VDSYWATQGPLYYLMVQLAWNPDRQIDEIMDDYYKSGFGPAAEDMKAYWNRLGAIHREIHSFENGKGGKSWVEAFSPDFFKGAYTLLDTAAGKASKAGTEYAARVAFVKAGLDYLRVNTDNMVLARQIIASEGSEPAIREKMRVNWQQLVDINQKFPEALRGAMLNTDGAKYKLGFIHPEADLKAIEEKKLRKEAVKKRVAQLPKLAAPDEEEIE
jgi:hypothetical protein